MHPNTIKFQNVKADEYSVEIFLRVLSTGVCDTKILFLLSLLVFVAFGMLFLNEQKITKIKLALERGKEGYGMVKFVGICILAMLCLIPGPVLGGLAGSLYGSRNGFLLIWITGLAMGSCRISFFIGTMVQSLTYVIGKHLLRDALVAFASKRLKSFSAYDAAIGQQGIDETVLVPERLCIRFQDNISSAFISNSSGQCLKLHFTNDICHLYAIYDIVIIGHYAMVCNFFLLWGCCIRHIFES